MNRITERKGSPHGEVKQLIPGMESEIILGDVKITINPVNENEIIEISAKNCRLILDGDIEWNTFKCEGRINKIVIPKKAIKK